jgi:hypothetical protein
MSNNQEFSKKGFHFQSLLWMKKKKEKEEGELLTDFLEILYTLLTWRLQR